MNNRRNYNTDRSFRARWLLIFLLLAVVCAGIGYMIGTAAQAEDQTVMCWVMCKPGNFVNVRKNPNKNSEIVGYLDCGDDFKTDAEIRNGFIHVYGIGEYGEGWVYCGYVATEKPEAVFQNYVCVAKNRVACRRWMNGPRIEGRSGWLYNLDTVSVFYIADGWAMTSRGYIQSEWLEVDPE
jgi:hypothetical protein